MSTKWYLFILNTADRLFGNIFKRMVVFEGSLNERNVGNNQVGLQYWWNDCRVGLTILSSPSLDRCVLLNQVQLRQVLTVGRQRFFTLNLCLVDLCLRVVGDLVGQGCVGGSGLVGQQCVVGSRSQLQLVNVLLGHFGLEGTQVVLELILEQEGSKRVTVGVLGASVGKSTADKLADLLESEITFKSWVQQAKEVVDWNVPDFMHPLRFSEISAHQLFHYNFQLSTMSRLGISAVWVPPEKVIVLKSSQHEQLYYFLVVPVLVLEVVVQLHGPDGTHRLECPEEGKGVRLDDGVKPHSY